MILTDEERWCAGRKFSRSQHLEHIEMYWVPTIRGVIARTIGATREFRLPPGAISIGIYTPPFNVETFLGDLEDLLVKTEREVLLRAIDRNDQDTDPNAAAV